MSSTTIRVTEMDHIVLRCRDVEARLAWYVDALGLDPVRVDEWRRGEVFFPSARVNAGTIIDFVGLPPGVALDDTAGALDHLCLVVEPIDLGALATTGRFDVVDGPGRRYGARGDGMSLYVRDPEGTVVELRYY